MVPSIWIELHQEMTRHPKTLALAQTLRISRREAVGLLVDLWTWGIGCAGETGSLRGLSPEGIAMALDWPVRQAGKLVDALVSCGWFDREGEDYRLHDWEDYTGRLSERRRDAERKRTARKAAKAGLPGGEKPPEKADGPQKETQACPEMVRGMSADGPGTKAGNPRAEKPNPTEPNRTEPNRTEPDPTQPNRVSRPSGSPDPHGQEAALRRVCDEFAGAIHAPGGKEREQLRFLLTEYGPDALSAAIGEARGKGRSPAYLRKILEAWRACPESAPGQAPAPSYDIEAYERLSLQCLMGEG